MSQGDAFLLLLSRLQAELNRLFKEFEELGEAGGTPGWTPSLDVIESADAVVVLAELPGLRAAELKLLVAGDELTIEGSKRTTLPRTKGAKFHRVERAQGAFRRRLRLPHPVNSRHAEAHLDNGLLRVSFPKIEDQRQRSRSLEIHELNHAKPN